jgi:hypothetical protein
MQHRSLNRFVIFLAVMAAGYGAWRSLSFDDSASPESITRMPGADTAPAAESAVSAGKRAPAQTEFRVAGFPGQDPAEPQRTRDREPAAPRPGPVEGAVIADGEVVTIRHWDLPPSPAARREIPREPILRELESATRQIEQWEARREALASDFQGLGGYLDADGQPFFDVVDGMPEERIEELEQLEMQILDLSASIEIKAAQIADYRAEWGLDR